MGEIIDFKAEWMHRKILEARDAHDFTGAEVIGNLLEGYLDGTFSMEFVGGEPKFAVVGEGSEGLTEGAST